MSVAGLSELVLGVVLGLHTSKRGGDDSGGSNDGLSDHSRRAHDCVGDGRSGDDGTVTRKEKLIIFRVVNILQP